MAVAVVQAVKYARPSSIEEAVALLEGGGPHARVLAGGTDLIVLARERRIDIDLFVDVKALDALTAITYAPEHGLTIGAAAPCYRIAASAAVQAHYPCLVDCATLIGGVAIQGRASLGGNLCNSSPAADGIPALIALEATVEIAGPGGRRSVAAERFCVGPGRNVLEAGEFVVALHLPPPPERSGAAFRRFIPRGEMDIAVTNAAVSLHFDGDRVRSVRVAIGAVAPTPLLVEEAASALTGAPLSESTVEAAAAAARRAAQPIDDMRGRIRQRRHLAGVLTTRCIHSAAERAGVAW